MGAFEVVLTVAVLVAVAVFILLFEKRRAKEIERDLRDGPPAPDDRERRRPDDPASGPSDTGTD